MKKNALLLSFLGLALRGHAQKSLKNEFSFGYFSAGKFFDNTKFDFSRFVRGKAFSLAYTREIGKKRSVGISYGSSFFYYLPDLPQPFETNAVLWRVQKNLSTNIGYGIPIGPIMARGKAGLRYNIVGGKTVHYYYGWRLAWFCSGIRILREIGRNNRGFRPSPNRLALLWRTRLRICPDVFWS